MKKAISCLLVTAMLGAAAFSMAACDDGGMLAKEPNQSVPAGVSESVKSYDKYAYYELENPSDVKFNFETTGKIQKVTFKYRNVDYSVKNDTIVIDKKVFEDETAGEKRIRVFVDNQYVEVALRVVTKVIYNTEDFNSIRTNLNGVYVLGCDIDFAGEEFWPIGKDAVLDEKGNYTTAPFEGIFDGMGYAVKNVNIHLDDKDVGEDQYGQGPSLAPEYIVVGNENQAKGYMYGAGIFMTTSANSQILNTRFLDIHVSGQGLIGPVAATNGGLIKNCFVTSTLEFHKVWWGAESAGGIVGQNAGGDMAGRIENCIAIYESISSGNHYAARGIADWNGGTISNCYAATVNSYVFHVGYDSETKSVPADFDYDDFFNGLIEKEDLDHIFGNQGKGIESYGWGWYTLPALPGTHGWDAYGSITNGGRSFYKNGDIINTEIVRRDFLLDPANFLEENGWDTSVWNFTYGAFPTLKTQR